jgi:hypothetical protein
MAESNEAKSARAGLPSSTMEGRMLVLEIVAMTSLALAIDSAEGNSAERGSGILQLVFDAVEARCAEAGMDECAARSARAYANEILGAAMESLYPTEH